MVEEDEIDLRPYVATLVRRWKLILGLAAAAAIAAAAWTLLTPRVYEATALVAIANFGSKPVVDTKAYLEMASGERLMAAAAEGLAARMGSAAPDASALRAAVRDGRMKATAGSDSSLVTLRVRDGDPARVAAIADVWAAALVQAARATYNPTADNARHLQSQLAMEQERLASAEAQLAAAHARTQLDLLRIELAARQEVLSRRHEERARLQSAAATASAIRERLSQSDGSALGSAPDDLSIMLVQARAQAVTVQLQLGAGFAPPAHSVGEQVAILENLSAVIAAQERETDRGIEETLQTIRSLQDRIRSAEQEVVPLNVARDNALATMKELDLKAAEAQAAVSAGVGQARVVGEVLPPPEPQPRSTARNAALAAILGLMAGAATAVVRERLGTGRPTSVALAERRAEVDAGARARLRETGGSAPA